MPATLQSETCKDTYANFVASRHIKREKVLLPVILGDPGADKMGEGKSKRAEKYIRNEEK